MYKEALIYLFAQEPKRLARSCNRFDDLMPNVYVISNLKKQSLISITNNKKTGKINQFSVTRRDFFQSPIVFDLTL